ncbi:MAG: hypothetical protein SFX74_03460 [Fimbriimonadaceae bacterium]|nr:hypothetical protein [Fimbriimonadaceae bacterium]
MMKQLWRKPAVLPVALGLMLLVALVVGHAISVEPLLAFWEAELKAVNHES